jgi:RND family efflux transporter MFP subunit
MRTYRLAFIFALIVNLALIGVLGGYWWKGRKFAMEQHPPTPAPSAASQPTPTNSPSSPAPPSETPLASVQLSPERLQSIGVKFGTVVRKTVQDEIRATGTVAIDETRLSYVQTRFSGHIEKVFVDATYQYVHKGQPLFTIHSPELVVAEREYLLAKQNQKNLSQSTIPGVAEGVASLLDSSKERLAQWNIPKEEISRLESTGEVSQTLTIDSPVSGYITERNALPNLNVQPETRLYTVADLSTVWVLAQVFQNDLGRIRMGTPAALTVDSYPGRTFRGRVDFIYPDVDMNTRTARARVIFSNANLTLSPGMFVNVVFQVPLGSQLVIPVTGVLQSGTRQIVFVDRGEGNLEPREVQLGPQAGEDFIVLGGLKAGDRIVTSANFLIDSESQLQAAMGSLVPAASGEGASPIAGTAAPGVSSQIEFTTEPTVPRMGTNVYRVKLTKSDGSPITGAQVSIRSYMPGMPEMGMPAMSVVSPLNEKGIGIYEGQAKLESSGTWQITITAIKDGVVISTKRQTINALGGN